MYRRLDLKVALSRVAPGKGTRGRANRLWSRVRIGTRACTTKTIRNYKRVMIFPVAQLLFDSLSSSWAETPNSPRADLNWSAGEYALRR